MFEIANYAEAVLWTLIGVIFAAAAMRLRQAAPGRCVLAAIVFVCFGASDVVEASTGAWWRPWWLLAWKAVCIAWLIGLLAVHVRDRRRRVR